MATSFDHPITESDLPAMDLDPYAPAARSRRDEHPPNGVDRPTTRRRGQGKAQAILGISDDHMLPSPARNGQKVTPTSFRNPMGNAAQPDRRSGDLSRSFSARAKGLPIDQDIRNSEKRYNDWAESQTEPQPQKDRRQRSSNVPETHSSSRNEPPAQSVRVSSANYQSSQRRASDTTSALQQPPPIAQPIRSSTLREQRDPTSPSSPTAGEWSHRSPLQKLEGTLNDISKEEKRARVQEAEMILRDSKVGGGSRREQRETAPVQASTEAPERRTSRRVPASESARTGDPNVARSSSTRTGDPNVARSSSTRQRENLPPITTTSAREPASRRMPADRPRESEYREHQRVSKPPQPIDRSIQATRQRYSPEDEPPHHEVADETLQPGGLQEDRTLPARAATTRERSERNAVPKSQPRPVSYQPQTGNQQNQSPRTRDVPRQRLEAGDANQNQSPRTRDVPRQRLDAGDGNQHSPIYSSRERDVERQPARHISKRSQEHADPADYPPNVAEQRTSGPIREGRTMRQDAPQPAAQVQEYSENRKSGPLHEANSSHKAALAEAATIGAGTAAAVARSNSKKLQKAPPKNLDPPVTNNRKRWSPEERVQFDDSAPAAQKTRDDDKYFLEHPPPQAQLSVRKSRLPQPTNRQVPAEKFRPGEAEDMESEPVQQKHHHVPAVFHHKLRQQSVSFREPSSTIRKLDEWRNGGVARLAEADFDLRDASASNDQPWWEGGNSGRRQSGAKATERNRALESLEGRTERHEGPVKAFDPPLYLKCGPLLRYTGLRREKIAKSNPRAPTERETWRGSVMIVTKDSQSSYGVAPTLRMFSQPMDLIPPPPAHIDDENGEKLAQEHIDPIAGLPKMSRMGKTLYVKPVDQLEEGHDVSRLENDDGLFETSPSFIDSEGEQVLSNSKSRLRTVDGEAAGKVREVRGVRLYADPSRNVTFWRFNLEIELSEHQRRIGYSINHGPTIGFWVPARGQSMNIMFHSCNGFSMSVDPNNFSGPDPMWRDVLNTHQSRPFHVMIGGGDQVYNDAVSRDTDLFAEWLSIKNPHEKHQFPFSPELKNELESFYLERYCMWFSQGLFGMANSEIPMVNIWDDHDIIDGFGSYPDHFMSTPVFMGLGSVAFKYYMLFQHQSVPEETQADEPSWLLGGAPGPYITEQSRSLFMYLGKGLALLGLDCRTERKKDQILSDETYDIIFDRCRRELVEGDVKHLIVLLGVPIAYPRLVWLENVLTSRAMDPIKAIGRMGMLGGFLNKFDGGVEILDDLDDHWTAKNHKEERNWLIEELQDLAAEKSARITILGGDVHLAAVGQFYSNPRLRIPKDRDHRYIPNIISSAIVNTPPPEMMGDILNKRNKIHHLDELTDEDMIPMFTHDVDGKPRNNKRLLPRRNWCSIREYQPGSTPPPTPPPQEQMTPDSQQQYPRGKLQRTFSLDRGDMKPGNLIRRLSQRGPPPSAWNADVEKKPVGLLRRLSQRGGAPPSSWNPDLARTGNNWRPSSAGNVPPPPQQDGYFPAQPPPNGNNGNSEPPVNAEGGLPIRPGVFHRRTTNLSERAAKKGGPVEENFDLNDHINLEGGLDIVINCEVNPKDPAGITTPYRLLVPALFYDGSSDLNHDHEHEHEHEHVEKKGWFKFGRNRSSMAANQGKGNWGGDPSEDSHSESEEDERPAPQARGYSGQEAYREKGKRRWFSKPVTMM